MEFDVPVPEEPTVQEQQPKNVNRLNDSMKLGLGAQKEHMNFKDRQDQFFTQFEQGTDRRLCYFLNETEEAISKNQELKIGSQDLSVQEMKDLKAQYISLF